MIRLNGLDLHEVEFFVRKFEIVFLQEFLLVEKTFEWRIIR